VKRFNIPSVVEFYASTEGNAVLVNSINRLGACGYRCAIHLCFPACTTKVASNVLGRFVSPLISRLMPNKLVRFNIETEEPVRDPKVPS
jgi:hypothetical protein